MTVPASDSSSDWVETFKAWVWEPPYMRWRVRGFFNATLFIRPGRFTMEARPFYRRVSGWEKLDYDWPTVVVETLRPLGGSGLLFEMSGQVARCAVQFQGARLRAALSRAGFVVVEWSHWGWEAPRQVPEAVIGEQVVNVPRAVFLPYNRHGPSSRRSER